MSKKRFTCECRKDVSNCCPNCKKCCKGDKRNGSKPPAFSSSDNKDSSAKTPRKPKVTTIRQQQTKHFLRNNLIKKGVSIEGIKSISVASPNNKHMGATRSARTRKNRIITAHKKEQN